MVAMVKRILEEEALRPDLYILLKAGQETISNRQLGKGERERNTAEFFRTRYYTALAEIHEELNETNIEEVETDHDVEVTLSSVIETLERRKVVVA